MTGKHMLLIAVSIVMLAVALAPACSSGTTSRPLEGTTWMLQSFGQPGNLKSVLKDAEISASFDAGKRQVSGSGGVNRYFAGYDLKGNRLSISGQLASTKMAGPPPLMDQEQEYFTLLQAAESYSIKGDKLTIASGSNVLIFTAK